MVYEKYIKRGGKTFGPYYYESYRDEKGMIKTRYLGEVNPKKSGHKLHIFLGLGFLFLLFLGIYQFGILGKVTGFVGLGASIPDYYVGDNFIGQVKIDIGEGDSIQKDSAISLVLLKDDKELLNKQISSEDFFSGLLSPVMIEQTSSVCSEFEQPNETMAENESVGTNESEMTGEFSVLTGNVVICSNETLSDYYFNQSGSYERNVEDFVDYSFADAGDYVFVFSIDSLDERFEQEITVEEVVNESRDSMDNFDVLSDNFGVFASPVLGSVLVNLSSDNNLTCWANATDADGNRLSYSGEWYKNGSLFVNNDWNKTVANGFTDAAYAIAVDSQGNSYVGGSTFNVATNNDYYLIKYNSTGGLVWSLNRSLGSDDKIYGIDVDSSNNVYVTGMVTGANANYYTIKYNSSGSHLWNASYDGGNQDHAYALVVDNSSNVYVTGDSNLGGKYKYYTIKYNSSGSQLWNATFSNGTADNAYGIDVDSSSNVYVTGYSSNGADYDYCTVKYNSSGSYLFNVTYNSGATDNAEDVVVDSLDNFYVSGLSGTNSDYYTVKYNSSGSYILNFSYVPTAASYHAYGIDVDDYNNLYLFGDGDSNFVLVKYDSLGNYIWNRTYDSSYTDYGRDVFVDSSNEVYIAGYYDTGAANEIYVANYKDGFGLNNQTSGQIVNVGVLDSSRITNGENWSCSVWAYDNSSRSSVMNSESFIVADYFGPVITVLSPENKTYGLTNFNFSVSLSENTSYCKFSLDNWVTNYSMLKHNNTYFNYSNISLNQSNYTANFWCNDSLNNPTTKSVGFYAGHNLVDLVLPNGSLYFTPHILINISSYDADSVSYNNGSTWKVYPGYPIWELFGAGNQVITARGNLSSRVEEASHSFKITSSAKPFGYANWCKNLTYNASSDCGVTKASADDSNNLVMVGSCTFGSSVETPWAVKFDSKGNLIWNKIYTSYKGILGGSFSDNEGGYLVVGSYDNGGGDYHSFLLELQPLTGDATLVNDDFAEHGSGMSIGEDGKTAFVYRNYDHLVNYLYDDLVSVWDKDLDISCGTSFDLHDVAVIDSSIYSIVHNCGSDSSGQSRLIKMTDSGISFNKQYNYSISDIKQYGSSLLLVGVNDSGGVLLKVDSSGNILWVLGEEKAGAILKNYDALSIDSINGDILVHKIEQSVVDTNSIIVRKFDSSGNLVYENTANCSSCGAGWEDYVGAYVAVGQNSSQAYLVGQAGGTNGSFAVQFIFGVDFLMEVTSPLTNYSYPAGTTSVTLNITLSEAAMPGQVRFLDGNGNWIQLATYGETPQTEFYYPNYPAVSGFNNITINATNTYGENLVQTVNFTITPNATPSTPSNGGGGSCSDSIWTCEDTTNSSCILCDSLNNCSSNIVVEGDAIYADWSGCFANNFINNFGTESQNKLLVFDSLMMDVNLSSCEFSSLNVKKGMVFRKCTNDCGTEKIDAVDCVPECSSDWVCDEWSGCVNGTQERVCEDVNACEFPTSDPKLERECSSLKEAGEKALKKVDDARKETPPWWIFVMTGMLLSLYRYSIFVRERKYLFQKVLDLKSIIKPTDNYVIAKDREEEKEKSQKAWWQRVLDKTREQWGA